LVSLLLTGGREQPQGDCSGDVMNALHRAPIGHGGGWRKPLRPARP
jgi:hypothetical protein